MLRALGACIGTVGLVGCATPAHQFEPSQAVGAHAEPQAPRNPAPQPQVRYPVGPEVLAFQNYGHVIADRVSSDPNFGGFIFKNEPRPHAIVMFTGDAEARLRRYTRDPRFKAQRVDLTLATLERMKDGMGEQLSRLSLRCYMVDGDEEHNTVTVGAPSSELNKIRSAIAQGLVRAPPKLRLEESACPEFR